MAETPPTALPTGVVRVSLPLVVDDLVTISDADLMRQIDQSPDISRPGHPDASLPPVFGVFFNATKFNTPPPTSHWAIPMLATPSQGDSESVVAQNYTTRIADTKQRLQRGFTDAQLATFDAIATGKEPASLADSGKKDDLREIAAACAKLMAPLIIPLKGEGGEEDKELPDEIAYASFDTLLDFPEMFNPFKYLGARRAREKAEKYVKELMPEAERPIDYVHNLGAAAQGLGKAMLRMRKIGRDGDGGEQQEWQQRVLEALAEEPVIDTVVRVPVTTTTLDGLLPEDKPLVPGKSIIVLENGKMFKQTKDTFFMFGSGVEQRQCPFKSLFLSTAESVADRKS